MASSRSKNASNTPSNPRLKSAAKWLVFGGASATLLFFTGGLAAIPGLKVLGAWAIGVAGPAIAGVSKTVLLPAARVLCIPGAGAGLLVTAGLPDDVRELQKEKESKESDAPPANGSASIDEQQRFASSATISSLNSAVSSSLANESKSVEETWYSNDEIENLIYPLQTNSQPSPGLKFVFIPQDEGSHEPKFYDQFTQLSMLKNFLNLPYACFIAMEPGAPSTPHFVMGILMGKQLLVINPVGQTTHQDFKQDLMKLAQTNRLDLILPTVRIQNDAGGSLKNCGPICVELMRHFSSFQGKDMKAFFEVAKAVQTSDDLATENVYLSFMPASLTILIRAKNQNEYNEMMQEIRSKRQAPPSTAVVAKANFDERTVMNRMVLEKMSIWDVEKLPEYQNLQTRFAPQGASSSPSASKSLQTKKHQ